MGGLLTKPLIRSLLHTHKHAGSQTSSSDDKNLSVRLLSNGQDLEANVDAGNPLDSRLDVHHYWRMFDDSYMRPVFGGRGFCHPASPAEEDYVH